MTANSDIPDKAGRVGKSKGGRPAGKLSSRSLRQNRLKQVLDQYIDPLMQKAMKKAEQILDTELENKAVSATVQLQAVKLIVDTNLKLREEVYKKERDQSEDLNDEVEETQGAVLSFVIPENRK
jgi:hypothetical protein